MDYKRIIAISFLVIALSVAYYLIVFLPQKEQDKENAKNECLIRAHDAYEKEGAQECVKRGYTENDYKNLKCYLPDSVLQHLLKGQSDWQKTCLEAYK